MPVTQLQIAELFAIHRLRILRRRPARYLLRRIPRLALRQRVAPVIKMAQATKDPGVDGVVIAIDTWLGSWEHFLTGDWRRSLGHILGYPTLFHTFMANVLSRDLQDYVMPLPLDSINAFKVLSRLGLGLVGTHATADTHWHLYRSGTVAISQSNGGDRATQLGEDLV